MTTKMTSKTSLEIWISMNRQSSTVAGVYNFFAFLYLAANQIFHLDLLLFFPVSNKWKNQGGLPSSLLLTLKTFSKFLINQTTSNWNHCNLFSLLKIASCAQIYSSLTFKYLPISHTLTNCQIIEPVVNVTVLDLLVVRTGLVTDSFTGKVVYSTKPVELQTQIWHAVLKLFLYLHCGKMEPPCLEKLQNEL